MTKSILILAFGVLVSSVCAVAAQPTTGGGVLLAADDPRSRTPGTVIDDAALTAKVKTALIGDEKTKARHIDVDTREGVVLLTGTAKSKEESDRATELAKGVTGVRSVDNKLTITP